MPNQNLPNPKCKIVIGIADPVIPLDPSGAKDAFNIEVTLSILSRGLGGARFTLQNFDAAYTGLITEGDTVHIYLDRSDATFDLFGGNITKLTPRNPNPPEYYIDVEAIDFGQKLQVPEALFSAWYNGALGKDIIIDAIENVDLPTDVDYDGNIASTHDKAFDEVLHWNVVKEMCDAVTMTDGAVGADGFVSSNGYVHVFKRGIYNSSVDLTDLIRSYSVDNDLYRVRNKAKVYSKPPKVDPYNRPSVIPGHAMPSNKDSWTEPADLANWLFSNVGYDYIDFPTGSPKVGTAYLRFNKVGMGNGWFRRMHDPINCLAQNAFKSINFWINYSNTYDHYHVRLLAPDATHYFETAPITPETAWVLKSLWIGADYEYDVDENPSGTWFPINSPDWTNITGVEWNADMLNTQTVSIDGLYYGNAPYQAEVAADPGSYGVRCLEPMWVEGLRSDYECEQHAQGLLEYYKNKVRTVNVSTFGDNGFVPGYMQHVEIANDAIDESFRILEIVHHLEDVDWTTSLVMGDEPIKLDWWVRKMWEKQRLASQSIGKF